MTCFYNRIRQRNSENGEGEVKGGGRGGIWDNLNEWTKMGWLESSAVERKILFFFFFFSFSLIIKWFQFLILGQSLQEWCRWPGCRFYSLFHAEKMSFFFLLNMAINSFISFLLGHCAIKYSIFWVRNVLKLLLNFWENGTFHVHTDLLQTYREEWTLRWSGRTGEAAVGSGSVFPPVSFFFFFQRSFRFIFWPPALVAVAMEMKPVKGTNQSGIEFKHFLVAVVNKTRRPISLKSDPDIKNKLINGRL